uniref:Uncharacterized protein n=1 Tax=Anopheles culicifacies TaxID=139723 RepID=A0A182LZH6_9DIPT
MESGVPSAPSLLSPVSAAAPSAGSYAIGQPPAASANVSTASAQPVAVTALASNNPPNGSVGTGQQSSLSPRRRARLQRSERLQSDHSQSSPSYSSWEALIRDSFGQIVWPIRITSWEMVQSDRPGGGGGGSGFMAGGRNASYHATDYVAASTESFEKAQAKVKGIISMMLHGSVTMSEISTL